ncbi:MAG: ribonuclease Z [Solirubrobacterales bacterium]
MDLDVVFLGTGGSLPTAKRATACVLARLGGDRLLFDCGEGTQRQMQRSIGLVQVDDIYLSHFHADHYLGVPGLLKTYDLTDREAPLRVFGPPGLKDLFGSLRRIFGRVGYEVELIELGEGEAVRHDGYEVRSFPVEHRVAAYGYAVVEDERPGHLDPERAAKLGVSHGPDLGRLQRGEEVQVNGKTVSPTEVMGDARIGRKVVVTGDTVPAEMTKLAAHQAQLLIHDAAFADADAQRAAETGHSTARQAAEIASEAGVEMLALVHASTRYDVRELLAEAREVVPGAIAPRDFDVVEIPFPERGSPKLVERGARPSRPSEAAPA